jgi:hypothetical protein
MCPVNPVDTYTDQKLEALPGYESTTDAVAFIPNTTFEKGTVVGQISSASANEVQTINFSAGGDAPTGGTFTLSIAGIDGGTFTSSALAYNISNANLKIAIEALLDSAGYEGATVTIGSGPAPADATVTFGGTAANWNMPLMVATSSLTAGEGASPTVAVDATTAGNRIGLFVPYDDDGTDDGRRVAKGICQYSFRTDNLGRVVYAGANTPPQGGAYETTAPVYFKGAFKTSELTGLDDNGAADLGRIIKGTVTDGVLVI